MSHQLINRSPHLLRLRNEGFNLHVNGAYLLIKDIPYVNSRCELQRGVLILQLALTADIAEIPPDHTAYFIGDTPCDSNGKPLDSIINNSNQQVLMPDLIANHYFSAKPRSGAYRDYYEKATLYIAMLAGPAQFIDPDVTAQTYAPVAALEEESVFVYTDTASSRAGIAAQTEKFKGLRIALVGLGGTGAYILDQIAKMPVSEIHLFDGDTLHQHNAFRYPGAVPFTTLEQALKKVEYLHQTYSQLHRGIVKHPYMISPENVGLLNNFDYVFLSVDRANIRALVVNHLLGSSTSIIDVGMGVHVVNDTQKIWGACRVTALTQAHHAHSARTLPLSDNGDVDLYRTNIQIADLNALNAIFAIGMWKRLCGFYADNIDALHSTYITNLNELGNSEVRDAC